MKIGMKITCESEFIVGKYFNYYYSRIQYKNQTKNIENAQTFDCHGSRQV